MTAIDKTVMESIAAKTGKTDERELLALNAFVLGFVAGSDKKELPAGKEH